MSDSILVTPGANSAPQQSKLSALDTTDNTVTSDDSVGFTAVLASYSETYPETSEQNMDENLTELLSSLLPQDMLEDGNSLPQEDQMAMWQTFMMLQPAENITANIQTNQQQNLGLFDNSRKPVINTSLLSQDYFNSLVAQNKEMSNALPANNVSAQLAAAHFIPDTQESLLLNVNEQLVPVQGSNSSLSQGISAVGFGTATQAANTQTQMAPLNLGQNAWETNLGSRLQMLVGKNVQTAEIRLDPPELGVLDVKIKVANDIATVNISSPNTQVRDALESAIPRLREMFAETGLSLGDVNVGQESFAQQQQGSDDEGIKLAESVDSDFSDEQVTVINQKLNNSLLDIYA